MPFEKGGPGGPGRPKGAQSRPNKMMIAFAEQHGDEWIEHVWAIASNPANKTADRLTALNIIGRKVFPDMKSVDITADVQENSVRTKLSSLTEEQFKQLTQIGVEHDREDEQDDSPKH